MIPSSIDSPIMPAFLSVYPYDIESPIENPSICLQKYLFHIVLILTNKGFFHGIARILFHRPRISKIHLDEMGNFIWPLLDGTRSVYEIGRLVEERFQDKAKPLYERLVQYLELLREYGFITFDNCGFHV